jgi:transcriptional regulator with XRE-family HTH domain
MNVPYADIPVKRNCPARAKSPDWVSRHNVRMAKRHPIRPHLRAWRLHFGKTLEWLANELGTSHSTVIRWESGENGVQQETFEAIARVYGITLAELSAPPTDAGRARELHRIMLALQAMDDRRLQRLADLAEDLAAPK